ncbi:hypothetical protein B0A55_09432 [Friedmanniomyces simplex]|uniref:NAD(P)-binding protein n=1 Tax=Friedmanniomyces simplex TaxID=329884 RepID=A0A4U0WQ41_9PEZI|nr:hypothetical protein B0A55_09432 [Friedmanniomyces simplex]
MSAFADSGAAPIAEFLESKHHDVDPAIDPSKVKLPNPYIVCVVGASRGIGAGIAHAYAHAGASGMVLASRRVSGLEQTASECKKINPDVHIEIVSCDITSDASVQELASQTQSRFGRLDVLIVNSGFTGPIQSKVTETPSDEFIAAANVNYIGTFLCAKHLIPLLLSTKNGAKAIIAIGTLGAFIVRGIVANPQYNVSKVAQLRLMEMIHDQYNPTDGLLAYTLHPGGVLTEMARDSAPEYMLEYLQDSTELCGAFCVWLTKDRSRDWLSGRFASVDWDVGELEAKKEGVVEKDLLKLKIDV